MYTLQYVFLLLYLSIYIYIYIYILPLSQHSLLDPTTLSVAHTLRHLQRLTTILSFLLSFYLVSYYVFLYITPDAPIFSRHTTTTPPIPPPYILTVLLTCPQPTFIYACMLATYTKLTSFQAYLLMLMFSSCVIIRCTHPPHTNFVSPSHPTHHFPYSYNYNHRHSYLFIFSFVSPTVRYHHQPTTLPHIYLVLL